MVNISRSENLLAGQSPDPMSSFEKNGTSHEMDTYSLQESSLHGQHRSPHCSGAGWCKDPGADLECGHQGQAFFPPGLEEPVAFGLWAGWSLIASGEAPSLCL